MSKFFLIMLLVLGSFSPVHADRADLVYHFTLSSLLGASITLVPALIWVEFVKRDNLMSALFEQAAAEQDFENQTQYLGQIKNDTIEANLTYNSLPCSENAWGNFKNASINLCTFDPAPTDPVASIQNYFNFYFINGSNSFQNITSTRMKYNQACSRSCWGPIYAERHFETLIIQQCSGQCLCKKNCHSVFYDFTDEYVFLKEGALLRGNSKISTFCPRLNAVLNISYVDVMRSTQDENQTETETFVRHIEDWTTGLDFYFETPFGTRHDLWVLDRSQSEKEQANQILNHLSNLCHDTKSDMENVTQADYNYLDSKLSKEIADLQQLELNQTELINQTTGFLKSKLEIVRQAQENYDLAQKQVYPIAFVAAPIFTGLIAVAIHQWNIRNQDAVRRF
ncbi:MAG: hypothetical protein WCK49_03215 [Myxococcaceae bacterium]